MRERPPEHRRADLPDDRARRRRRADAADAAVSPASTSAGARTASAQLFADLERTAQELAEAADATPFYALEGGPLGTFATVHPLGGCPMADDAAHGVVDDIGARARPPGPVRARRLDRADLARRQPVQDDRRARRARRRTAWRRSWPEPRVAQPHGQPALQPARDRAPADARRARRARAPGRAGGHDRARRRRRALVVGRRADRRLPRRARRNLSGPAGPRRGTLRDGVERPTLVRVLGGTHLRQLNAGARRARAWRCRTWAATTSRRSPASSSTSTHGSGLRWGPFPDFVRSLDLVVAGGEVVRVEPAGGIHRPGALRRHERDADPGRRHVPRRGLRDGLAWG